MITDWSLATATAQAVAVAAGEVSSVELVTSYAERIEALNPQLNAVITLDVDNALAAARRADEAVRRGDRLGPLHGAPFTAKDAIATAGLRTTAGTAEFSDYLPRNDAVVIQRLREAGAILLGKTNLPAWSGDIQTHNEVFGTTRNPWDLDRTPGGSSGGAAVAVAAGLTGFEVGSDIGGSLRIPAHFCGVYSHRPSYGLVPQRGFLSSPHGDDLEMDINVLGPIARSVGDLQRLLGVMAGPSPSHAAAWSVNLPPPRKPRNGAWRIGLWFDEADTPLDPEIRSCLSAAAEVMQNGGAQLTVDRPDINVIESRELCSAGIIAAMTPTATTPEAEARGGSHAEWLRARVRREQIRGIWADWFTRYDALLCPVLGTAAFPHDHAGTIATRTVEIAGESQTHREFAHAWNGPIGLVGLPTTTVPIGVTSAGLPVGMQIVGPFLEDLTPLAIAAHFEELTGGFQPPPGVSPSTSALRK